MALNKSEHFSVYNDQLIFSGNISVAASPQLYEASALIIAILAIFYGSISLVSLVGNSLVVIIIAGNKRMQSVTNFLLANLASSDILIAVAAVPFQFQAALLQRWVLPHFMCILAPFVQVLSVNVSIFTLTVISIERYRALLYPFKPRISKSAVKYAIPVIWTLSGICAAPMAATLRVELFDDPHSYSGKKAFCYPSALSSPFNDSRKAKEEALEASTRIFAGYVVFLVAIQFIAPLIIIGFAYLNIAKHLWGSHMETPGERPNDVNSTRTKQRQKVIKMLIMVVALFAFCWFPLQAYNFLTAVIPHINSYPYINIIWFCCNFLAMSNSCQNPFILGLCNEKFRQELRSKIGFIYRLCVGQRGRQINMPQSMPEYHGISQRNVDVCTDHLQTMGYSHRASLKEQYNGKKSLAGKRCADHAKIGLDSPLHLSKSCVVSIAKRED